MESDFLTSYDKLKKAKTAQEIDQCITDLGEKIHIKSAFNNTLLIRFIGRYRTDIALALIKAGVDVNAVNDGRGTALLCASIYRLWNVCYALIDAGADINVSNISGQRSPFICAIMDKNEKLITILIKKSIEIYSMKPWLSSETIEYITWNFDPKKSVMKLMRNMKYSKSMLLLTKHWGLFRDLPKDLKREVYRFLI